jgi:hypothetical protein
VRRTLRCVCGRVLIRASLDRGSIGNARLYNLEPDLHITDAQYLLALTVFFFPYAIFEVQRTYPLQCMTPFG